MGYIWACHFCTGELRKELMISWWRRWEKILILGKEWICPWHLDHYSFNLLPLLLLPIPCRPLYVQQILWIYLRRLIKVSFGEIKLTLLNCIWLLGIRCANGAINEAWAWSIWMVMFWLGQFGACYRTMTSFGLEFYLPNMEIYVNLTQGKHFGPLPVLGVVSWKVLWCWKKTYCKVGHGGYIRFWLDDWLGEGSLMPSYVAYRGSMKVSSFLFYFWTLFSLGKNPICPNPPCWGIEQIEVGYTHYFWWKYGST